MVKKIEENISGENTMNKTNEMKKMKVQVIGLGIVGSAQAYLAHELGYDVVGYDPQYEEHDHCEAQSSITGDADITFICTPEAVVPEVVANLVKIDHGGLIVVKSTVPVGTVESLRNKYNIHIAHNPEFLREKTNLEDVMNPSRTIIGECCAEHGQLLRKFYEPLNNPIYNTDYKTSEVMKLVSNSFRAVAITFWNEIAILCRHRDVDVEEVSKMCDPAKLIGEWEGGQWGTKFFLQPYDGKCLPKDIRHLITAFRAVGENPKLFDACEEFNNKLKERKFE